MSQKMKRARCDTCGWVGDAKPPKYAHPDCDAKGRAVLKKDIKTPYMWPPIYSDEPPPPPFEELVEMWEREEKEAEAKKKQEKQQKKAEKGKRRNPLQKRKS